MEKQCGKSSREKWYDLPKPSISASEKLRYETDLKQIRHLESPESLIGQLGIGHAPADALKDIIDKEDAFIVAPIMTGGLPFGRKVEEYLEGLSKSLGFALVGFSHERRWELRTKEDVFITESDRQFLARNKDKPILLVDNVNTTNNTKDVMISRLVELGFDEKRIYYVSEMEP